MLNLSRNCLIFLKFTTNKLYTKREILDKISFDTTFHDIYHPDFSSWDFKLLEKKENSHLNNIEMTPQEFIDEFNINYHCETDRKQFSPIGIKNSPQFISEVINRDYDSNHQSLFSRNMSQNTWGKDLSNSSSKRK